MLKLLFCLSFLAGLFLTLDVRAESQPTCGMYKDILEWFRLSYGEEPVSIGLASNGSVIQVLRSEEGTWTIVMVQPNGIACLMAAGEGWQNMNEDCINPSKSTLKVRPSCKKQEM